MICKVGGFAVVWVGVCLFGWLVCTLVLGLVLVLCCLRFGMLLMFGALFAWVFPRYFVLVVLVCVMVFLVGGFGDSVSLI